MSTSITWELPQLAMDLLVWSVVGLRGRFGGPGGRREFPGRDLRRCRQGEAEPCAAGVVGVEPDLPAEVLDDLAGHGQADAGARVGGPLVQPLEDHEDALSVLRLDADAVVGKSEQPGPIVTADRDHDPRRLSAAELQRV